MKLLLEQLADEKIRTFTALATGEISGLGKVRVEGDDFIVTDVVIFDQEVSGVHSTIPMEALAKFQHEMVKKGESLKEWVLWWHSHANMDVFFSSTDTDTIYNSSEFPYLVSLVVNKARESKARVDVFKPVHMYMELDVDTINRISDEVYEICQAEIEKKVKKPEPKRTGFLDVPERHGKQGAIELPRSTKLLEDLEAEEQHTHVVTYEEGIDEYRSHKKMLLKMLKRARRDSDTGEVYRLEGELSEWILFGKSMGFEIMMEAR